MFSINYCFFSQTPHIKLMKIYVKVIVTTHRGKCCSIETRNVRRHSDVNDIHTKIFANKSSRPTRNEDAVGKSSRQNEHGQEPGHVKTIVIYTKRKNQTGSLQDKNLQMPMSRDRNNDRLHRTHHI